VLICILILRRPKNNYTPFTGDGLSSSQTRTKEREHERIPGLPPYSSYKDEFIPETINTMK
jgi:hypothetical protein